MRNSTGTTIEQKKYLEQERVLDLATILGNQAEYETMLKLVTETTTELLDADIVSVVMINPRTQHTLKTVIKSQKEENEKSYQLLRANVIGWCMVRNQVFFSENINQDDRFRKGVFGKNTLRSVICVPLKNENIAIGYLLAMKRSETFDDSRLDLIKRIAAVSAPFLLNRQQIEMYFKPTISKDALVSKYEKLGMYGQSERYVEMLHSIEAATRCDVRVILQGQSGTGKELIARAIHEFSERREKPFVVVDCGTIPANLVESELFGFKKGSFTGASQDRKGLIQEAESGTLFMDEIACLPLDMQAKLLRFLQEGEIRVVGSNVPRKVDVRIISACSTPLNKLVEQGEFREDLFYRLHVYPVNVPSLNDRRDDIPILANHFLGKFSSGQTKKVKAFDQSVVRFLKERLWLGNIRELENFIERLVTIAPVDVPEISAKIIPVEYRKEMKRISESVDIPSSLQEKLDQYEQELLLKALKSENWNQSAAARKLKISEGTLRYKMSKLKIKSR